MWLEEVTQNLIKAEEEAIEVLLNLYEDDEVAYMKEDIAYVLFNETNNRDLERILLREDVNTEEIVEFGMIKRQIKRSGRLAGQRRRHEKREDFALSIEQWSETINEFNGECCYCGKKGKLTYEHFRAFSKGGAFIKSNIIPACPHCNGSKNDRLFEDWYHKKDFYSKEREQKILNFVEKHKD